MIQVNEAMNLALVFVLGPMIWTTARRHVRPPHAKWLLVGGLLIVAAYVLTVLEGFFLPDLLNVLEHLCIAAAGVFFAAGLLTARVPSRTERGADR